MLAVIAALERSDFYKSMTTHADHRVWQDVYHAMTRSRIFPAGVAGAAGKCCSTLMARRVTRLPATRWRAGR
jgi:hypothetical protein